MELLTGTFMKIYTGIYGGSGGVGGGEHSASFQLLIIFNTNFNHL